MTEYHERGAMRPEYLEKFNALVDRVEGDACWLWRGSRLPSGYGRFYPARHVGLYAHRVAWEIANGRPVPAGLVVMHACDNPRCVRPDHLSIGTSGENLQDAIDKGRHRAPRLEGDDHPHAKLTDADCAAIRSAIARGERHREIADRFGVTRGRVSQIGRGARAERGEPA